MRRVFIGSYTSWGAEPGDGAGRGRADGVTAWDRDPETGGLTPAGPAVAVAEPSYLAAHPSLPVLYAVSEREDGQVVAIGVDTAEGAMREASRQPTGGADPCHLAVDPTGRYLAAANYTGGSLSVHPIGDDGALLPRRDLVRHIGGGPVTGRQEGPHVHMTRFTPDGRHLLAADLGNDTVRTYGMSAHDGRLRPLYVTHLPPGTGPRHLAFAPSGLAYLVGELAGTLTVLRPAGDGALTVLGTHPLTDDHGPNLAAAVVISPDGRFVYVSNRGPDSITVFATTGDHLRKVAEVPSGGTGPRDIAMIGGHLYAANERSDRVTVFDRDPSTGLLKQTASVETPSPVCVLPWR
ncbi:MAG TPA: lactonase family protein [Streptosporangiaceae bacterium]|jgi:6-phosphogluconolactonase (cycloisomerase 2 family)